MFENILIFQSRFERIFIRIKIHFEKFDCQHITLYRYALKQHLYVFKITRFVFVLFFLSLSSSSVWVFNVICGSVSDGPHFLLHQQHHWNQGWRKQICNNTETSDTTDCCQYRWGSFFTVFLKCWPLTLLFNQPLTHTYVFMHTISHIHTHSNSHPPL